MSSIFRQTTLAPLPFTAPLWSRDGERDNPMRISTFAKVTECFWFTLSHEWVEKNFVLERCIDEGRFYAIQLNRWEMPSIHWGYWCLSLLGCVLVLPLIVFACSKWYFRTQYEYLIAVPFVIPLPPKDFHEPSRIIESNILAAPGMYEEMGKEWHNQEHQVWCGWMGSDGSDLDLLRRALHEMGLAKINSDYGQVLLSHAIRTENVKAVKLLVEAGAKNWAIGRTDHEGNPVVYPFLAEALARGQRLTVAYLLAQGADPQVIYEKEGRQYSSLPCIIRNAQCLNLDCIKYLFVYTYDRTSLANTGSKNILSPLQAALDVDDAELFEYLLYQGAEISKVFGYNDPMDALFFEAARREKVNIITFLLNKGFPIDRQQSTTGYTALHFAAANKSDSLLQLLLYKGAATDIRDREGRTYKEHGAHTLNGHAVDLALRMLSREEKRSKTKSRPEDETTESPFREDSALSKCIPYIQKVNDSIDDEGNTLFHLAMKRIGNVGIRITEEDIQTLLDHGACPFAINKMNQTPFDLFKEEIIIQLSAGKQLYGDLSMEDLCAILAGQELGYQSEIDAVTGFPKDVRNLVWEYTTGSSNGLIDNMRASLLPYSETDFALEKICRRTRFVLKRLTSTPDFEYTFTKTNKAR